MDSKFLSNQNNLFQSKEWVAFQEEIGNKTFWLDQALFIKKSFWKNKFYLYCPKGPIIKIKNQKSKIKNIEEQLKNWFQEVSKDDKSIVFARIEPVIKGVEKIDFEKIGFKKPKVLTQQKSPEDTLVLNLQKSEEEILSQMKQKTRYNIRLAEKKGLKIRKGQKIKDLDTFYNLLLEVKERDPSFAPYEKKYYLKLFQTLNPNGILELFIAEYNHKPLAAIMVSFYHQTATYLHGGSSNIGRELMPTYLIQWEAIKEAKKRGCLFYDFWGIAVKKSKTKNQKSKMDSSAMPQNDKWEIDEKHSWAGVTRFKIGFGGEKLHFIGTFDFVFDKFWYNFLALAGKTKRMVRR